MGRNRSINEQLEKIWGIEGLPTTLPEAYIPRPSGFIVAEPKPIYWRGEWQLYYVRKVGLTTHEAGEALARQLGATSYAYYGLKDKDAIAYQHIGVLNPRTTPYRVSLMGGRLLALLVAKNASKPVLGLHGWNSFYIRVRLTASGSHQTSNYKVKRFFPNYYGPQRFGLCSPNSHILGYYLLKGETETLRREVKKLYPQVRGRIPSWLRRLWIDAYRAYVWNKALGEALKKRSLEEAPQATLNCPRVAGVVRVPALPLPALKRRGPSWWEEIVDSILDRHGIPREALASYRPALRPAFSYACTLYILFAKDPEIQTLAFTLPRGSYATIFLRSLFRIDWARDCREVRLPEIPYEYIG